MKRDVRVLLVLIKSAVSFIEIWQTLNGDGWVFWWFISFIYKRKTLEKTFAVYMDRHDVSDDSINIQFSCWLFDVPFSMITFRYRWVIRLVGSEKNDTHELSSIESQSIDFSGFSSRSSVENRKLVSSSFAEHV